MFRILFWDFLQTIETVFCASRNHISRGKKVKIFTFAYGQGGSGDPPPLTVSLTVKYPFFYAFP